MKTVTLGALLSCLFGIVCLNALAEGPSVSQVTVRQRWPWSRLVDIDYVLNADPGTVYDVQVQAYNGAQPLNIPANAFSGHLYNVTEGARRIVFDPAKTGYVNTEIMTQFKVSITPTVPALYMIIDLTKSPGTVGQIEYVYEDALHAGTYGAVETNFVSGIDSLTWTGVTNNSTYKDQKMVLRRVSSGSVTNSSGQSISVSKDYYIAVFETTQNQWKQIDGVYPECHWQGIRTRPVEKVASYDRLRGSVGAGVNWPSTGDCVDPASFVAQTRGKTGVGGFDLPSKSQWEYACRAGTSTLFNDNAYDATTAEVGGTNQWLHVLGRYKGNANSIPAVVGSYKPNAWGLYDMHGNVQEWTLDWFSVGAQRTRCGGAWMYEAGRCNSAYSNGSAPSDADNYYMNGFRFAINLE